MGGLSGHPSRDATLEGLLEARGIGWELCDVALREVDWAATRRANPRGVAVDKETVERYVGALERGEALPAGFGVDDGGKVTIHGGEHRALAHRSAGAAAMPLYLVSGDQREIHLVGIEHNARHGLAMSPNQAAGLAAQLIDSDRLTQAEAAQVTGLKVSQVRRRVTLDKGAARAKRLGLGGVWGAMAKQPRWLISSSTGRWSDAVFAEVVTTANNCDVDTATAQALVDGLKQFDTDDAAFEWLEGFEAAYIAGGGASSRVSPQSQAVALRRLLISLGDLDPERVAAGTTESFASPTLASIVRAAERLMKVQSAVQARWPNARR